MPARKIPPTSGDALLNLGPVSRHMLAAAGIHSTQQIRKLGALETYCRVKKVEPRASLNLLWGIAAGLEGVHWRELSTETRGELLLALDARRDLETRK